MPMMSEDKVREILGGSKFVSQRQVEEARAATVSAATSVVDEPLKPLAQVLRENKEAKEAKSKERWEDMKRGKNRPLEDEELLFLDQVATEEHVRERQLKLEENQALAQFQLLQTLAKDKEVGAEEKEISKTDRDASLSVVTSTPAAAAAMVKRKKPKIIVVKKRKSDHDHVSTEDIKKARVTTAPCDDGNRSKEEEETDSSEEEGGLGGLLSAYDSD